MRPCTGTRAATAALLSLVLLAGCAGSPAAKERKLLFFTRNVGFYHEVVQRKEQPLSVAEQALVEMASRLGVEVHCTKDGRVFDRDLDEYDAIAFYTNNDLTTPNKAGEPPMSAAGKRRLLAAVEGGKGFMAFHSTTGSWRTPGEKYANSTKVDPFIAMIGGEFIAHGPQQEATIEVASTQFPEIAALAPSFKMHEEWYAVKNLAKDMHVILVQQTRGMKGDCYRRPPFPSTWARYQGKGRVFCTTMAHRADVWQGDTFQGIVISGLKWILGDSKTDIRPNIDTATPGAHTLKQ